MPCWPVLELRLGGVQATEALRITAPELVNFGVMDAIIPEPMGGAHGNPMAAFPAIKDAIMNIYHSRCSMQLSPAPHAVHQMLTSLCIALLSALGSAYITLPACYV